MVSKLNCVNMVKRSATLGLSTLSLSLAHDSLLTGLLL